VIQSLSTCPVFGVHYIELGDSASQETGSNSGGIGAPGAQMIDAHTEFGHQALIKPP